MTTRLLTLIEAAALELGNQPRKVFRIWKGEVCHMTTIMFIVDLVDGDKNYKSLSLMLK